MFFSRGGDLIIGIGEFTYELHWRAGGTAGPSVSAVSFATRAGAAELIVMRKKLLLCVFFFCDFSWFSA